MLTTTNTTITMIWTQPSFAPQTYEGHRQCQRLCEQTLIHTNSSISSPYTFTGIDPGTYCIVSLYGIYGSDTIVLGAENIATLSLSGKICYIIIFTIIILFSYYL